MWAILVLALLLFQNTLGDLIVQVQDGPVQGTTFYTSSGRPFYAWRGIPFAKPPLGELRYQPPVKAVPWDFLWDASYDRPSCLAFPVGPGTSEDCLYINVYSPVAVGSNLTANSNLPVLFWIYGGAYVGGSSNFYLYDPTPFLEENVIVVSFNYRLGPLGFLSTEDNVVSGNAGLKDQLQALQWTKDNIAAFGGSPQDITIFGESAGGISVGYHVVSPKSRGLFKGAIMQSGSALPYGLFQFNARDYAVSLASQINPSVTKASPSEEIKNILQAVPAELVVTLSNGKTGAVVLEVESESAFLSSPFYESIESGNIARVPVIIGFNSEESIAFTGSLEGATQMALQHDSNLLSLLPNMPLKADPNIVAQEIREEYVGKDGLFGNNIASFLEWFSDDLFLRSSTKHAILQSQFSPTYMYQFSFYGTASENNYVVPGAERKVAHGQELTYMFNSPLKTEADYLTRRRLVKLWTNFAKTSNPTPDDDSLLQNVKWAPITADNVFYLDIDDNLEIKPNRKAKETVFWDHIWSTYSYRPYNTF